MGAQYLGISNVGVYSDLNMGSPAKKGLEPLLCWLKSLPLEPQVRKKWSCNREHKCKEQLILENYYPPSCANVSVSQYDIDVPQKYHF